MKNDSVISDLNTEKNNIKKVIRSRKLKNAAIVFGVIANSLLISGSLTLATTKLMNKDPMSEEKQYQEYITDFSDSNGVTSQYTYEEPTSYINEKCEDSIIINTVSKWYREEGCWKRSNNSYLIKGQELIEKFKNIPTTEITDELVKSLNIKKINSFLDIERNISEEQKEAPEYVFTQFQHDGKLITVDEGWRGKIANRNDFNDLLGYVTFIVTLIMTSAFAKDHRRNRLEIEGLTDELDNVEDKIAKLKLSM